MPLSGHEAVWHFVVLQAAYGTAEAFFTPSIAGFVPQLVDDGGVRQANALVRMTASLPLVAGPVLGGLLIAFVGSAGHHR